MKWMKKLSNNVERTECEPIPKPEYEKVYHNTTEKESISFDRKIEYIQFSSGSSIVVAYDDESVSNGVRNLSVVDGVNWISVYGYVNKDYSEICSVSNKTVEYSEIIGTIDGSVEYDTTYKVLSFDLINENEFPDRARNEGGEIKEQYLDDEHTYTERELIDVDDSERTVLNESFSSVIQQAADNGVVSLGDRYIVAGRSGKVSDIVSD